MMKKKLAALALALLLLAPSIAAVAKEATALPYGVTFQMDYAAVLETLGDAVEEDAWEDEAGVLLLPAGPSGVEGLEAEGLSFQVDRNNSDRASRLSQISISLPTGDSSVASFRKALTALIGAYGQPDGDPFGEESVSNYVEYGNLSATWTNEDARINLSLSRMYQESLTLEISNRLCYRAEDLK